MLTNVASSSLSTFTLFPCLLRTQAAGREVSLRFGSAETAPPPPPPERLKSRRKFCQRQRPPNLDDACLPASLPGCLRRCSWHSDRTGHLCLVSLIHRKGGESSIFSGFSVSDLNGGRGPGSRAAATAAWILGVPPPGRRPCGFPSCAAEGAFRGAGGGRVLYPAARPRNFVI